jgi:curved DNA-binding protein CbpA
MAGRDLWDQVDGDLYQVLGVTSKADSEQLQYAWRQAAKRSHPDLGGDIEEFKSIEIAYQVLSNPLERQRYDRYRHHMQAFASHNTRTRRAPFAPYAPGPSPDDEYDDTDPYLWASPNFAYSAPPNRRPRAATEPGQERPPRNPWLVFVSVLVGVILFVAAIMLALVSFVMFFGILVLFAARALRPRADAPTRQ